jgi:hypothetical protein
VHLPFVGNVADLFTFYLFGAASAAALVVKVWAVADAAIRPSEAFPAAGKRTKVFWVGVLLVALVLTLFFFGDLGIIGIIAVVVSIVYLADVRPAVREVGHHRRRGGSSSSYGPYGPW